MTRGSEQEYRTSLNGVDYVLVARPLERPARTRVSLTLSRGAKPVAGVERDFELPFDPVSLAGIVRTVWNWGLESDDGRLVYLDPRARDRLIDTLGPAV